MLKGLLKRIIHHTWRPVVLRYIKKDRTYKYHGITIRVRKGVFHPGLFFSSLILVEFISRIQLKDKTLLELGAGAGLLSICAARQGALVTASEISKTAIDTVVQNAAANKVRVETILSDLFLAIPERKFDYIFINPPYYKRKPLSEEEKAWYCGENLEYFQALFKQLLPFMNPETSVYMILSEDCELEEIKALAVKNHFKMEEVLRKKKWWEWNYIFRIIPIHQA